MTSFENYGVDTAPTESRALLQDSEREFGWIPGLHGVMAAAPALLDSYKHLHKQFSEKTSFNADELTVVWQTINVEHECHYCVPGHTALAKAMKVDDAITNALRDETPLPNARLEALRRFTRLMVQGRGNVADSEVQAFLDAGFTKRQILEVVLGLAQKVISNYTNHLARTPVDPQMQAFVWSRGSVAAE